MSPRRQATEDRKWFRLRQTADDAETSGSGQAVQAAPAGLPLPAPTPPTPAAADEEMPATTESPAEAGTAPDAKPLADARPPADAGTVAGAGTPTDAGTPASTRLAHGQEFVTGEVAKPPSTIPAATDRPAPSGFSHRRGTARTRAAQADLAARGSSIVPAPQISGMEPAWRQTSSSPAAADQEPAARRAAEPQDAVQGESAAADAASAEATPQDGIPAQAPPAAAATQVEMPAEASPQTSKPAVPGAETRAAAVPAAALADVPPADVPSAAALADAAAEVPTAGEPPAVAPPAVAVPPGAAASPASATEPAAPAAARPVRERPVSLSARLMALARMIQIGSARSGRDGFGARLLADAEDVLAKAGERMRLSSAHTVVVLAGGTGSGKSSLFNRLAGAEFSTVGVTRPVTRDAHACVWGREQGSGAILEWLKVPGRHRYARSSELDSGEEDLAGLVLLDLPDHDSVMNHAGEQVDRLVGMADVMIWVLDPQKYADAAVHRRFLIPMAGHSAVVAVVLNQVDLLDPAQVDDCVADLRRLLDSENLPDVPIVVTSAVTGAGLDDLRALLGRGVAARRAATVRISADLDGVVARFLPFAADVRTEPAAADTDGVSLPTAIDKAEPGEATTWSSGANGEGAARGRIAAFSAGAAVVADVPLEARRRLAERLAAAAGVVAIGETLRSARELRAIDFVGWPVAWFVQRVTGRDPARKARIGALRSDLRAVTAGPAGAQQSEIDNALTELSAELAGPLPKPWSVTIRNAVRSRADQLPAAIGSAIGEALPPDDEVLWWWRLAGLWQGLLLGTAVVAIAWSLLIAVVRILNAQTSMPGLMSDPGAVPWLVAAAIVALGLGAATTSLCLKAVQSVGEREKAQVTAGMQASVAAVAQEMVIAEAEQELSEFLRYCQEASVAADGTEQAAVG